MWGALSGINPFYEQVVKRPHENDICSPRGRRERAHKVNAAKRQRFHKLGWSFEASHPVAKFSLSLARVTVFDKLVGILVNVGPKEAGIKDLFGGQDDRLRDSPAPICVRGTLKSKFLEEEDHIGAISALASLPFWQRDTLRANGPHDAFIRKDEWSILLEKMSHRSGYFGKILYEFPVKTGMTKKTPNSFDSGGMRREEGEEIRRGRGGGGGGSGGGVMGDWGAIIHGITQRPRSNNHVNFHSLLQPCLERLPPDNLWNVPGALPKAESACDGKSICVQEFFNFFLDDIVDFGINPSPDADCMFIDLFH
ncbi:hypothetical protein Tco_0312488 [Tanacetum coccineum]